MALSIPKVATAFSRWALAATLIYLLLEHLRRHQCVPGNPCEKLGAWDFGFLIGVLVAVLILAVPGFAGRAVAGIRAWRDKTTSPTPPTGG